MNNTDKLRQIFAEALEIPKGRISDSLEYNTVPEWDSVAHMALVAAIDNGFDIMMETDDVIDMSSFGKAKEILKKYGVEF
ncbi:MAG TPA: acyl carrier protein [candidate division Zixibacteria bacterium]|nr:acyl carrier protein [candidate division Zixibacteria bacterium]